MEAKAVKQLRAVLNLVVPLVLAAATFLTMLFYQRQAVERSRQRAYVTLTDSAEEQIATLNARLNGQFAALEAFSGSITAADRADVERIRSRMESVAQASNFSSVMLVDINGLGINEAGGSIDVSDREYFTRALTGGRTMEKISSGRYDRQPHFIMAVPVTEGGKIVGVLLGSYSEESFRSVIISEIYSGRGFSFICEADGTVIVGDEYADFVLAGDNVLESSAGADREYPDPENDIESDLINGRPGLMLYSDGGERRYAVYQPLDVGGWMFFNVIPADVIDAEVAEATHTGNIAVLCMTVTAALLISFTVIVSRRQSKKLLLEQERLRASEERFSVALENSSVSIREYDQRSRLIFGTGRDAALKSLPPSSPERMVELGLVHPEDAQAYIDLFKRLDAGAPNADGVFRVREPDGEWRYNRIHYANLFNDSGECYRAIGTYEDVTEKYTEQLTYEQELSYQRLAAADMYASALLDVTERRIRRMVVGKEEVRETLERATFEELFEMNAQTVVSDEEVRRFFQSLTPELLEERFKKGQTLITFEYLRRLGDGQERWVRDQCRLMREPLSGHLTAFFSLQDIDSERRKLEDLELAAETDAMTGFYNHDAAIAHIENYLSLDGSEGVHAMYMVDIDNFKQVNDTFGHLVGDECIRQVAASLRRIFRTSDLIGRMGGDEFLVLMKNVGSAGGACRKAQEVVDKLQFAYTSAGTSMQVSVSLGVNVITAGGSVGDMVAQADAALYQAKKSGKHRYAAAEGCLIPGEPKRSEDAAASRAGLIQFQALLEYMDSGVVLLELGESIRQIYVSPGFCRMMGVRQEDYPLPRLLRDVRVHPDDLPGYESALRTGVEWGTVVDYVCRSGSDGEHWHWRHTRAVRIPYETSSLPVLIANVSDIDRLKRQEEELDFREQRYRIALSKTGATVWEMDLRTGDIFRSGGGKTIEKSIRRFEGGREALLDSGLIHQDSIGEFRRMIKDITDGDDSGAYSLLTRDEGGGFNWGTARFALLRTPEGRPYYAIGVLERHQGPGQELAVFERELRMSGELTGRLNAVCRADLSRKLIEYFSMNNGQYCSTEPQSFDDAHALLPEFLSPDEDRMAEVMEATTAESLVQDFRSGRSYRILEFRRLSSDGSARWTSCSIVLTPHPVTGDIYAFAYMRDIQQRRLWELAAGIELARDDESFLFTAASARALIESIRERAEDKSALCSLCVVEFSRLDEIRETRGDAAAAATVLSIGRLLRMLIDGGAIVGRLDWDHAVTFRPDVGSPDEQLRRIEETGAQVERLCRLARVDFSCRLITGVAVEPIGELDYPAMLERAQSACRQADEKARRSVILYE